MTPAEHTIDARGLLCPQPLILLARAARDRPGTVIVLLADDPAAESDVPAWCRLRGASLESTEDLTAHTAYRVRMAPKAGGSDNAAGSMSK